jgi:hypothetical protein
MSRLVAVVLLLAVTLAVAVWVWRSADRRIPLMRRGLQVNCAAYAASTCIHRGKKQAAYK